ncbi:MAG: putative N-acetylmannosamine-6-phosphate 2-epimerase [Bacteroidetes bacterium]|nr:MAG: putative N-acetylmannosamine-6-phosphate 2-epimerase [Bacteroidota bacterium]
MNKILNQLQNQLIVSCQAEGKSPFNNPEDVAKFAICAEMGGAAGIRTEGVEKAKAIRARVNLPLIGLVKTEFEDGSVRITGSDKDVKDLIDAGCDMVAIDGTFRRREGMTGPEFIRTMKQKYNILIMADIATFEEGIACAEAGADCLSTTLSGYTPETSENDLSGPDLDLIKKLNKHFAGRIPVIAEGRYNTPELARQAIEAGAWAVVTGTAITRPQVITKWFYDAIKK